MVCCLGGPGEDGLVIKPNYFRYWLVAWYENLTWQEEA